MALTISMAIRLSIWCIVKYKDIDYSLSTHRVTRNVTVRGTV